MGFKQYVTEEKTKEQKIVMLKVSKDSDKRLRKYAIKNGFDLTIDYDGNPQKVTDFGFHLTIIASNNEVEIDNQSRAIPPIELTPTKFEVLGVDRMIPTIRVDTNHDLQLLRDYFIKVHDFEPTFADFKPHLSLSYNWEGEPKLKELELPKFKITGDKLSVKKFEPK